jgi:hypothetical protein
MMNISGSTHVGLIQKDLVFSDSHIAFTNACAGDYIIILLQNFC